MSVLAAIITFYTRLPMWRFINVPSEYFKNIIHYWAVAGWLIASVMAGVLYLSAMLFPVSVAVVLAIIARLLLTGALHEDGLADFCDGFGGSLSKERTLAIMKDSHMGSYGAIGLILYFLLLYSLLSSLPIHLACVVILVADPFCKGLCSMITLRLSYARTEQDSKLKIVYSTMTINYIMIALGFGLVPFISLFYLLSPIYYFCAVVPILVFLLLTQLMEVRIQGYTGDCVGALFLLVELSFYLSFVALVGLV